MKLPHVLTEHEVGRLLKATDNLKHKCIMMLIYSGGLRLGELIQLRLADLEPDKGRIFVYGGKGKKDRCTILSPKVWQQLQEYIAVYRPVDWVFEGQDGGRIAPAVYRISSRTPRRSRGLTLMQPYIPFGTPSPPTYWKRVLTCAIYKTCWAMKAARPPRYTHTSRA